MKRMRRSPDVVKQVAVGKDGSVVYEKKELLVGKWHFKQSIVTVGIDGSVVYEKREHYRWMNGTSISTVDCIEGWQCCPTHRALCR